MKAVGFKQHGDLSQMAILELPKPIPKTDEVLVAVKASAFNHLDIWVRKGWPGLQLTLPHISGSDAAGIVAAVGESVTQLKVGDRVAVDPGIVTVEDEFTEQGEPSISPHYHILGEQLPGTHCEFIAVPAKNLIKLPETISFEVAAASGLVSLTAWRMLMHRAQIQPGESVLILGAGGGVNSIAIQLAKLMGCKVYAITGGEHKVKLAKSLGADFVVDYRADQNWWKTMLQASNKEGFDVVVDNVGAATFSHSLRLVKRGGRIAIVGNTSGPMIELDIRYLFSKQISLLGSTMGSHADYKKVMQFVFDGKIKPVIHQVLPLSHGVEGMALLERGEQFGKIVLQPE